MVNPASERPAGSWATPTPSLTPVEQPDAGVRRYLDRFGVAAVYIICGPAGYPCIIGSGTDLADELKAARSTWPPKIDAPILVAAWWCFDLRSAQQIATLAIASDLRLARRAQRFALSFDEAARAITSAAGRLKFRLTPHAAVLAKAKAAGVTLESKLAAAQATGGLKEFNAEYQRRRRAAQAAGRRFMHYNEARGRFRAVLAAAAAGKPVGDVLRAVFEGAF